MRSIKIILIFTTFIFYSVITSCDGFLDVNESPNSVNKVSEDLLLSALLGNFSFEVLGQGSREASMYIQHIASNNPTPNEDNYVDPFKGTQGIWGYSYQDVLKNADILTKQATENENYAYSAISKTITAWTIVYLTNMWGPVPYTEALKPETTSKPKYDSQESIYIAAQELLDEALVDIDKASVISPSSHDLLYGGDLVKWKRLMNTLKAVFHITLTEAPGYSAADQAQKALTALNNGFQSNADNAEFKYYANAQAENPYYQWAIDDKWHDEYPVSEHYINLLQTLNDPRLPVQARKNEDDIYRGHLNGTDREPIATLSLIGEFYSNADAPLYFLNYDEALFIKAEATLIVSGAAAAQPIYEAAVRASLENSGVASADITTYMATLPDLNTSTNALEDLMLQKYIAGFLNISPYNDWRRTGFPHINLAENAAINQIPYRLPWVQQEQYYNLENLLATGIPVGIDGMKVKVWWHTRP